MREILFRGQQRKKGEKVRLDGSPVESSWFYGNGVLQSRGQSSIIYQTEPVFSKHSVYSDTLGQYTGVTDKNGNKIFEGDIVRYGDTIHEVVFEQRNGTAYFGLVYSEAETLPFGHYQDLRQIEVIGNIYDNHELLEDGEKDD